jgi:hypothetical protein
MSEAFDSEKFIRFLEAERSRAKPASPNTNEARLRDQLAGDPINTLSQMIDYKLLPLIKRLDNKGAQPAPEKSSTDQFVEAAPGIGLSVLLALAIAPLIILFYGQPTWWQFVEHGVPLLVISTVAATAFTINACLIRRWK